MYKQHILVLSLGFVGGLVASACVASSSNGSHCRSAQGDQTCAERYGDARPFCTTAACDASSEGRYGCVAERPADDCYYPCGGDSDVTVDDSCVLAGDDAGGDGHMSDDDGGMGGDADGGEGAAACMGPDDCSDPAAAFCDLNTGTCVGCGGMSDADQACAGVDPGLPVCLADVCVACTAEKLGSCGGTAPVCDVSSNACVACGDHDQCPDSACNLAVGSCFEPGAVLHVDGDNADCDNADGTEEHAYCTLTDALTDIPDQTRIIVHEHGDSYEESVEITTTVALFAADGERPVLEGVDGGPAITVLADGRLFARGVDLAETGDDGVGLIISDGQAWIEGARVTNNQGGAIRMNGGMLQLENCFVGGGAGADDIIDIESGEVSLIYSTIGAGNNNDSRALVCTAESGVTIRNSIIVALHDEPEIACDSADIVDSVTEADPEMNFDNNSLWFLDASNGDFSLDAATYPDQISGMANWRTGDPRTDIDGNLRPTADGTPDFAGADRLP
ncbi:right-handed parallel beta-helix repeat-containing protein [Enhygromyxa salina]|uniref:Right handed beta helix domain-containing protein n=1 Tax=Enhygromyxa salina TaxID=215803 RepID=A0A2S9YVP0_9BACT|nr:right-handed parallel beta-helix repeat-containing protein [Enhygromyxa salina]PRQ09168.1 hypothetical protein ENSA7_11580 [Enhygromyxa salina]